MQSVPTLQSCVSFGSNGSNLIAEAMSSPNYSMGIEQFMNSTSAQLNLSQLSSAASSLSAGVSAGGATQAGGVTQRLSRLSEVQDESITPAPSDSQLQQRSLHEQFLGSHSTNSYSLAPGGSSANMVLSCGTSVTTSNVGCEQTPITSTMNPVNATMNPFGCSPLQLNGAVEQQQNLWMPNKPIFDGSFITNNLMSSSTSCNSALPQPMLSPHMLSSLDQFLPTIGNQQMIRGRGLTNSSNDPSHPRNSVNLLQMPTAVNYSSRADQDGAAGVANHAAHGGGGVVVQLGGGSSTIVPTSNMLSARVDRQHGAGTGDQNSASTASKLVVPPLLDHRANSANLSDSPVPDSRESRSPSSTTNKQSTTPRFPNFCFTPLATTHPLDPGMTNFNNSESPCPGEIGQMHELQDRCSSSPGELQTLKKCGSKILELAEEESFQEETLELDRLLQGETLLEDWSTQRGRAPSFGELINSGVLEGVDHCLETGDVVRAIAATAAVPVPDDDENDPVSYLCSRLNLTAEITGATCSAKELVGGLVALGRRFLVGGWWEVVVGEVGDLRIVYTDLS